MATDTIGEDAELVVRLHHHLRRPQAGLPGHLRRRAGELERGAVPLRVLGRQRRRWHRGIAEILRKHRGMIANPRYGRIGLIALPYYVVFELLAPFIELSALVLLPARPVGTFGGLRIRLAVRAGGDGYGLLVSLVSLFIEEVLVPPLSALVRPVARGAGGDRGELRVPPDSRRVAGVRGAAAWRGRQAVWGSHAPPGLRRPPRVSCRRSWSGTPAPQS
jgi:hypothetical protein